MKTFGEKETPGNLEKKRKTGCCGAVAYPSLGEEGDLLRWTEKEGTSSSPGTVETSLLHAKVVDESHHCGNVVQAWDRPEAAKRALTSPIK